MGTVQQISGRLISWLFCSKVQIDDTVENFTMDIRRREHCFYEKKNNDGVAKQKDIFLRELGEQ